MVEIGERPILWHIMKSYSHYGFSDFVVCLGYKGYVIKEYFSNYFLHMSDVTFDMRDNSMVVHQNAAEPWRVTLVDTGPETQTGGRIKRIGEYVRRRHLHADLRRRRRRRGHPGAARLPPGPRPPGDDHRGPAVGTLRRDADRRRRNGRAVHRAGRQGLPGEAGGRWRLGERRVLRAGAGSAGPDRGRRDPVRTGAARGPGRGWRAAGVPAPWVLAADGRPARPARAPGPVGLGRGAVGGVEARRRRGRPMGLAETYAGRSVFVTGHTGFKGAWLAEWLGSMGAEVTGYALDPPTQPNLFDALELGSRVRHVVADVRDRDRLAAEVQARAAVDHLPPGRAGDRAAPRTPSPARRSRPTSWARSTCSRLPGPARPCGQS